MLCHRNNIFKIWHELYHQRCAFLIHVPAELGGCRRDSQAVLGPAVHRASIGLGGRH